MQSKCGSVLFKIFGSLVLTVMPMLFSPVSSAGGFLKLPDGSKVDLTQKCPVCGMVVGGPDEQGVSLTFKDGHVVGFRGAAAVFKDGHVVGFEGARCLFIYNSLAEKYHINVADIARQYVTDYASKKMIDLPKAFLVLGSNVKGPMGYDLIPFTSKEAAAEFASENQGKWIVQLHEVAKSAQKETQGKSSTEEPETRGTIEKKTLTPGQTRGQIQYPVLEKSGNPPVIQPNQPAISPASRGGG
jgi:copper chaperone NosL